MSPYGFAPGYLVYLLEIFLPGVGFGELLGIWRNKESLAERIALAFALGLSVDTIVFLIKTSGFAGLSGLSVGTVYFVLGLGAVVFALSFALRRKILFPVKPVRMDYVLFAVVLLQSLMLLVYFQKYPIFPEYFTQDPTVHVNYVESLISGQTTSIPSGLLYFGVHYQLASGVLLVGGEPLVVLQRIMAILVALSPLLFYHASRKLFSSPRAALIITVIYAFSGMVWYAGVFDSGLYPNFYGILAILFLIISVINLTERPSALGGVAFIIALINGYMSHYTFLTLLPALLVLPILRLTLVRNIKDASLRGYAISAIVALAPAAVPFLVYPNLASRILFLATSGGGTQAASTYLSNLFASFPVLSFLAVEMENDVALIVCLLLTAVFVYRFITTKNILLSVPIVWLVSLFAVAPFNISAWRYSYEALVPLTIIAGFATYSFLPAAYRDDMGGKQQSQKKGAIRTRIQTRGGQSQLLPLAVITVLLGTLLVGSWGQSMLGDALTDTKKIASSQNSVYQSIYWLKSNTPNGSQYLSVSDWRFTYTSLMIGRLTHYEYVYNVTTALELAKNTSSDYIIVTNIVTANVPKYGALYPWDNFPLTSNGNLTLQYNSSDVRIYQIASG